MWDAVCDTNGADTENGGERSLDGTDAPTTEVTEQRGPLRRASAREVHKHYGVSDALALKGVTDKAVPAD
jgi:hypothetical protein